jgi:hypothetical protein
VPHIGEYQAEPIEGGDPVALDAAAQEILTGLSAGSDAGFDIRRITDAGSRAGVVIYSLDTRGLAAPPPGASASSRRGSSRPRSA